jgi:hypothetical protein
VNGVYANNRRAIGGKSNPYHTVQTKKKEYFFSFLSNLFVDVKDFAVCIFQRSLALLLAQQWKTARR